MPASRKPSAAATVTAVVIVDDHPILRHGLAELINREPDIQVSGEADSAELALELLTKTPCDVVIVDISLPGISGIELVRTLKERHPDVRSLVMSMHDESLYAERALRAGAHGYIMKQEATRQIIAAIRRIREDEIYVSDKMQTRILGRLVNAQRETDDSPLSLLSDRELEVFRLIGRGLKKGEIARQIKRSVHTVEAHRANIKRKLKIKTAAELSRLAFKVVDETP